MHGIIARARSLWRGARRRADVEAEMTEEFQHHLALLTEDLVRRGLPPAEAARRARIEFGHIPSHKEDARAARGLGVLDAIGFSWLDVKLGVRMLRKYPGLSLVSVLGMSVAIAVGAGYFGVIGAFLDPTLPLDEGDRVVAIRNDVVTASGESRQTLRDLVAWRDGLRTVRELGAFTSGRRNLLVRGRSTELVEVAQMTASGFRVARTSPALGRALVGEDEREGAPPVVVIAHEEWQRVFGGDPAILGRPLRLGGEVHTVVGVMPAGFRFPVSHRYWVPLTQRASVVARGGGPSLVVFGRLAAGATLDDARAELAVVGARMAVAHPDTHRQLRPRVLPYPLVFSGLPTPEGGMAVRAAQVAVGLLLVLVAANVAILVYARVATRAGEIAMRTALGASRRRVITQLFAEALVLSSIAAVLGLSLAGAGLAAIRQMEQRESGASSPFWLDLSLSPGVFAYVAGLAIVAGVIIGVVPALMATGRRVQAGLQRLASRGSQNHLGRTWTALIVVQVAIAVAVLPFAVHTARRSVARASADPGYPAGELLRAWLSADPAAVPADLDSAAAARAAQARYADRAGELVRRLQAEPAVAGVAFASHFPGDEGGGRVEVAGVGARPTALSATEDERGGWVRTSRVDPALFRVFDVPIVAGRGFVDADARDSSAVIVDRTFVARFLAGTPVLGRRVRFLTRARGAEPGDLTPGPWLEIVGVVPDFTATSNFDATDPKVYRAMTVDGAAAGMHLVVRVRGSDAPAFAGRVRDIAAAVDPTLQLDELEGADAAERQSRRAALLLGVMVLAVTASVLLLSATGIYAMMSFTVARRRREIGIRAALGADPRRILGGVFARAGTQLGAGALCGLVLAGVVDTLAGGSLAAEGVVLLPAVVGLVMTVGLLAALGPARRGLAVQPTEALREE